MRAQSWQRLLATPVVISVWHANSIAHVVEFPVRLRQNRAEAFKQCRVSQLLINMRESLCFLRIK